MGLFWGCLPPCKAERMVAKGQRWGGDRRVWALTLLRLKAGRNQTWKDLDWDKYSFLLIDWFLINNKKGAKHKDNINEDTYIAKENEEKSM